LKNKKEVDMQQPSLEQIMEAVLKEVRSEVRVRYSTFSDLHQFLNSILRDLGVDERVSYNSISYKERPLLGPPEKERAGLDFDFK
jgi:hypothetical protein